MTHQKSVQKHPTDIHELNDAARRAGLCLVAFRHEVKVIGYRGDNHQAPPELMDALIANRERLNALLSDSAQLSADTPTRAHSLLEQLGDQLDAFRAMIDEGRATGHVTDSIWISLAGLVEDLGLNIRDIQRAVEAYPE